MTAAIASRVYHHSANEDSSHEMEEDDEKSSDTLKVLLVPTEYNVYTQIVHVHTATGM